MVILNKQSEILECVMNISEGSDLSVIHLFGDLVSNSPGVRLLHLDPNSDANRTVISFAGFPKDVVQTALDVYRLAQKKIDMRLHQGAHPRLGAVDVCPLIPLQNISVELAVLYSHKLAEAVAKLGIPVYLYQHSCKNPKYKHLEWIRKGEYEALPSKLKNPDWSPDYGPSEFNPNFGATVVGVRDLLIAYNISIETQSVKLAKKIASMIRSSGSKSSPGLLKDVKAIGWFMPEYKCCQVSTNLVNYNCTSLHHVFSWVQFICTSLNIKILGSEIIGLVPEAALIRAGHFSKKEQSSSKLELMQQAIEYLKLKWSNFDIDTQILEHQLFKQLGPKRR